MGVEVVEAAEDLEGHDGELRLREGSVSSEHGIQSSQIHVLHHNGDVTAGQIDDLMAADDLRRVRAAEDVTFSGDLAADGRVAIAVDHLESVDGGSPLVPHLVDRTAVSMAEDLQLLIIGNGG